MADVVYNPFSDEEEIIVKDKDGKIHIVNASEMKSKAEPSALAKEPIPPLPPSPKPFASYTGVGKTAEEIMQKWGVKLPTPELEKRLTAIVVTFLKGIRDLIETREILERSRDTGGMSFSKEDAEKFLNIMNGKNTGKAGLSQKISEDKPQSFEKSYQQPREGIPKIMAQSPPAKPAVDKGAHDILLEEEKKDILRMIDELPEFSIVPPPKSPSREVPTTGLQSVLPSSPTPPAPEKFQPAPRQKISEPVIFKEKIRPKLVGPIEELRELDTAELRRLDPDSKKACQKIREKILMLEKDSFQNMTHGIAAWRQSPVSKLCIGMGEESITQKLSIDKISERRKNEGRPYLTLREFEAIMDLNEQIRF